MSSSMSERLCSPSEFLLSISTTFKLTLWAPYHLTVVNRFTRWPEAIPLKDATASTCARALVLQLISQFWVPLHISTDRGMQLISQLWSSIAQSLGMWFHHTMAYHPQSNGPIECFHHHLKAVLRAHLSHPSWTKDLRWVILGIRTAPKNDLGCSSAKLVYGQLLTVSGDFINSRNHPAGRSSELLRCMSKQVHFYIYANPHLPARGLTYSHPTRPQQSQVCLHQT